MKNVVYDLPIMETSVMVGETLRRIQHLINIRRVPNNQRTFHTPYEAYTHGHMSGFNSVVTDALAVPAGVSINNLKREGLLPMSWKNHPVAFHDENTTILQLQWPFQLENMRIIDVDNNLSGFDLTDIRQDNPKVDNPHVRLEPSAEVGNSKYWNDIMDVDGYTVAQMIHKQYGDYRILSEDTGDLNTIELCAELKWRLAAELAPDRKVFMLLYNLPTH